MEKSMIYSPKLWKFDLVWINYGIFLKLWLTIVNYSLL